MIVKCFSWKFLTSNKHRKDIQMARFCDRVDLLMKEKQFTRTYVARRLGLAPSTVFRWFERNSTPNYETLTAIAEMFDVDIDWLRGVTEERGHYSDPYQRKEDNKKEDELDEELIRLLRGLTPAQQQRVRDFVSGLKG